ncbi:hypothetical protein [Shinella sp.]|uniref:hypothetical protein n=1 Tax=Shinella sp. TaxID=1870904 RepID=UPI0028A87EAE|nr:hypothetical protein [Shinella sp.]
MHYALEESNRDRRAVRSQPRGASVERLIEMFGTGEALGWLTDNLRRELFAQGRVGNGERSTAERLLSSEELDGVVAVMIKRHEGLSGTNVFAVSNPIALLFNWLDLGDGEGPRRLIGENVVSDIGLVEKLEALRSTITTSDEGSV